LTSRLNRPTFNRISGASRVASSCVGYALYTTHERPFFFNQSISTGKIFFALRLASYILDTGHYTSFSFSAP
jgi:hypothetical protein